MALLKWSIDRTDAILDSLASSASESDPEAMHITELPPALVREEHALNARSQSGHGEWFSLEKKRAQMPLNAKLAPMPTLDHSGILAYGCAYAEAAVPPIRRMRCRFASVRAEPGDGSQ
jgi:hypothetical protein